MNMMIVFALISLMIYSHCSAQGQNAENLNLIRSLFINPRRQQQQPQQPFQQAQVQQQSQQATQQQPWQQQLWQQTQARQQPQQQQQQPQTQQQSSGTGNAQNFNPVILPTIYLPVPPLPPMPQQPTLPRVIDAGSQWHNTGFTMRNGRLIPFSTDTSLLPQIQNDGVRTFQGLNIDTLFQDRVRPNLPRQNIDLRQIGNPSAILPANNVGVQTSNTAQFRGNVPASTNTNTAIVPQPTLREFNNINEIGNTNSLNTGVLRNHLSPFQIYPFPHTVPTSHPSLSGLSGLPTQGMFQSSESNPSQTNNVATFTSNIIDSRTSLASSKTSSQQPAGSLNNPQEWMLKLADGLMKMRADQNP